MIETWGKKTTSNHPIYTTNTFILTFGKKKSFVYISSGSGREKIILEQITSFPIKNVTTENEQNRRKNVCIINQWLPAPFDKY